MANHFARHVAYLTLEVCVAHRTNCAFPSEVCVPLPKRAFCLYTVNKLYCHFDYCARFSGNALDLNAKLWPMIIVSVVVFDLINYCISGNRKKNLGFKQPKYWKNEICLEQVNKALMCRISLSYNSTIYQVLLIYIYINIHYTLYTIHIGYMLIRVFDCIYQ